MTEKKLRDRMIDSNLSVKDGPLSLRVVHLEKALKIAIPPKSQSDRTCYRKVANWILEKCCNGKFNPDEILPRALDFALEATIPFDPISLGLYSVYDVQKKSYRFIPLENVICIRFAKNNYRIVA